MFRKLMSSVAFALALVAGMAATPAQATPIGLSLLIDGSGSITTANFLIQKNGYFNALNSVLAADGSVAIEVYQFANNTEQLVFGLTVIGSPAQKLALLTALAGMSQLGGNTPTGTAIEKAVTDLKGFFGNTLPGRQIIDVSTDGFGNSGTNESVAAANAVAAGVEQVNVLCIGSVANCTFNRGVGSFDIPATFGNFQASLETKLRRELALVPEPGPLALLAIGLLTMVFARRRA